MSTICANASSAKLGIFEFDLERLVPMKVTLIGVVATAIVTVSVGWAGWVSLQLIDIKVQSSEIRPLSERVQRIASSLPDQLAIAAQEFLDRDIGSAVAVDTTPTWESGRYLRTVSVIVPELQTAKLISFEVNNERDFGKLPDLLLRLQSRDENAKLLRQVISFASKNHADVRLNSGQIDFNKSLVTSLNGQDVYHELYSNLGGIRSTNDIKILRDMSTYRQLLTMIETEFRPKSREVQP